jgi:NAD-dependent dihydropyrimidine dehydrogenase PreA subunit
VIREFIKKKIEGSMKDSTRGLFSLHGWNNVGRFLHAYYYLAHLDQYVKVLLPGLRALDKFVPASRKEAVRSVFAFMPDRYHAKVIPLEAAKKIVTMDQDVSVSPETSKKVIPFEIANQITIRNPDSIVVMDCACRSEKKSPCQPINVCMVVGEPYATFALEHARSLHPRRLTQQEAVGLLETCHKKGHVHNAYFKDILGDQFYAICNCCKCCCAGIEVERVVRSIAFQQPIKELAPSGYLASVDEKKCRACGVCVAKCPFEAVSIEDEVAVIDPDGCMGCGVCPDLCPEEAIALEEDPARGIPLDLQALRYEARPNG